MKAIMKIIARTYKINEEYLNKLEMPSRLVCFEWVRLQRIDFKARSLKTDYTYRKNLSKTECCNLNVAINCRSINMKENERMERTTKTQTRRWWRWKKNGDTNAEFHQSTSAHSLHFRCHRRCFRALSMAFILALLMLMLWRLFCWLSNCECHNWFFFSFLFLKIILMHPHFGATYLNMCTPFNSSV